MKCYLHTYYGIVYQLLFQPEVILHICNTADSVLVYCTCAPFYILLLVLLNGAQ